MEKGEGTENEGDKELGICFGERMKFGMGGERMRRRNREK